MFHRQEEENLIDVKQYEELLNRKIAEIKKHRLIYTNVVYPALPFYLIIVFDTVHIGENKDKYFVEFETLSELDNAAEHYEILKSWVMATFPRPSAGFDPAKPMVHYALVGLNG